MVIPVRQGEFAFKAESPQPEVALGRRGKIRNQFFRRPTERRLTPHPLLITDSQASQISCVFSFLRFIWNASFLFSPLSDRQPERPPTGGDSAVEVR